MYQCPDNRIKYSCNCQNNGNKVQCHRECKVQTDRRHHPFGKPEKMREFPYIIVYQSDVCRVYGNIASNLAHGDAHAGFFQRRRIVDAVSDHTDGLILLFIRINPDQFVFGQAVCVHFTDMELSGDMSGSIFMVSRQKDRSHTAGFYSIYRIRSILTQCIRESNKAGASVVHCKVDDSAPFSRNISAFSIISSVRVISLSANSSRFPANTL